MPYTLPLTRDDVQLLAAVRKHLRDDGWTVYGSGARHDGARLEADWLYPWTADGKTGRILQIRLLTPYGSTQRVVFDVDVDSVREAVDLAVAVGLLPQGMSSAYQAGAESARSEQPESAPQPWLPSGWHPDTDDTRPLPRLLGFTPIPDPALRQGDQ